MDSIKSLQFFALAAAIALVVLCLSYSIAAAAGTFVQAAGQSGVVVVNQLNGNITFCPSLVNPNGGPPQGRCSRIGVISPTSLSGNVQISTAEATAFITNLATGLMVQCALTATNGFPTGMCTAGQVQ